MRKILVIDDDERIGATIQICLETHEGYKVITAPDGKAGIKAAGKEHPDLILLDIDMPKMNGLDVLKHLGAKPSTRYIPVIMLTGVDTPEAKDEANYEYAEQYIEKPCDMSLLHSKIEGILSRR